MIKRDRSNKGKYWFLFLLSVVGLVGVYIYAGGYASLMLAPVTTFFAQALDLF